MGPMAEEMEAEVLDASLLVGSQLGIGHRSAMCPDTCGSDEHYYFWRGTGLEYVRSPDTCGKVVLLTKIQ